MLKEVKRLYNCLDRRICLIFYPKAESHTAFECFEYVLALSRGRLTLMASDLTQYVCNSSAVRELCDNMIHKTELHERDAAENALKLLIQI